MTTSGITSFNLYVDEIIDEAFGLLIGNQTYSGVDARRARRYLNLLFLDMSNRGSPLSKVVEYSVNLSPNQNTVVLPSGTLDVLYLTAQVGDTAMPVTYKSETEFFKIPTKTQKGVRPTIYTVRKGRDDVSVKLWPVPKDDSVTLNFQLDTKIETVTKSTETVDVPPKYLNAVIYGLAWMLSGVRTDISLEKRASLQINYEQFLETARGEDVEEADTLVQPWSYLYGGK